MKRESNPENGMSLETRKYLAVRAAWGGICAIENHKGWGITLKQAAKHFFEQTEKLLDLAEDKDELTRMLEQYNQGEFTPAQFIAYVDAYTKVGGKG